MTTLPLVPTTHLPERPRELRTSRDELRLRQLAHEAALASADRVVSVSLREFLR